MRTPCSAVAGAACALGGCGEAPQVDAQCDLAGESCCIGIGPTQVPSPVLAPGSSCAGAGGTCVPLGGCPSPQVALSAHNDCPSASRLSTIALAQCCAPAPALGRPGNTGGDGSTCAAAGGHCPESGRCVAGAETALAAESNDCPTRFHGTFVQCCAPAIGAAATCGSLGGRCALGDLCARGQRKLAGACSAGEACCKC